MFCYQEISYIGTVDSVNTMDIKVISLVSNFILLKLYFGASVTKGMQFNFDQ